jgi:hypothetical protein
MEQPRRFQVDPPRRVVVVGSRGSGRGRVARLLAERFALPLVEIEADRQRFMAGAVSQAGWREAVATMATASDWIICGNDVPTLDLRVARADWLIWVDLPLSTCALAVIRRALRGRAVAKRELASGLPPRWPSLRDLFSFPTEVAPRLMAMIERERRNRTIFILRSRGEIERFLARLPEAGGLGDHRASPGGPPA